MTVHDRFRAWTKNGLWGAILQGLSDPDRDEEGVMIDSPAIRVHAHGANPVGGQEAQGWLVLPPVHLIKIHSACDVMGVTCCGSS